MYNINLIEFLSTLNRVDDYNFGIWVNPNNYNTEYEIYKFDYNELQNPHMFDEMIKWGIGLAPQPYDNRYLDGFIECPKDWIYIGSLNQLSFAIQNDVQAVTTFIQNEVKLDEDETVDNLVEAWCDGDLSPEFKAVVEKGIASTLKYWAIKEAAEFVNEQVPELILRSQAYAQYLANEENRLK